MINKLLFTMKGGKSAADALEIIKNLVGYVGADVVERLRRAAQNRAPLGLGDTKYDYAFRILYADYVDLEAVDFVGDRIAKIPADWELRQMIIREFRACNEKGLISDKYLIASFSKFFSDLRATADKVVINCPGCRKKLRVPAHKTLEVTCPVCECVWTEST